MQAMPWLNAATAMLGQHMLLHAGPDLVPSAIFQNGRKCSLVNVAGAAFARPMAAPATGIESAETPVRVQGSNIIGVDGNVLKLKGINWFGFDVSSCFAGYLLTDSMTLQHTACPAANCTGCSQ